MIVPIPGLPHFQGLHPSSRSTEKQLGLASNARALQGAVTIPVVQQLGHDVSEELLDDLRGIAAAVDGVCRR